MCLKKWNLSTRGLNFSFCWTSKAQRRKAFDKRPAAPIVSFESQFENGKESIVIGRKKFCFHRHPENSRPERDKSIESALIAFSSAVHTMTWTSHRTPF